jgi:hypothetical protein
MTAFRRMLIVILTLAALCLAAAAQQPDQLAAARVLGPQWKQLARASGMVFAGTVLGVTALPATSDRAMPTIEVKFRIDQAIAGVNSGQILTIREWAGAWSEHRAMRTGQRILLFLYPPSRLGLTSPVGGPMGQVALDPSGKNVAAPAAIGNAASRARPPFRTFAQRSVSLTQLERAIRDAREE